METEICCKYFLEIAPKLQWFSFTEKTGDKFLVMPCIPETTIRINYCPSCGKVVREIQLNSNKINQ